MEVRKDNKQPHVVFIPFPLQGHISPTMKLAQLFHQKGFHITLILTEFIYKRLFKSSTNRTLFPHFHLETFHDGLPSSPDAAADTQDPYSVCVSSRKNFFPAIRDVVLRLGRNHSIPPVSCIVADILMPFTISIAKEIGVHCMLFWTSSASSYMIYKSHPLLKKNGVIPVRDEELGNTVNCIPGLKNIRGKELPFYAEDEFEFPVKELQEACEFASGIILNTFDSLDQDVLRAISSIYTNVYAIGPLQMLLNSTFNYVANSTIRSNLLEEEPQCLKWLDSMEPNSVLYISFGSLVIMTLEQLTEFAWGILNSNRPFLWIIRNNLVKNGSTALPPDLMTKARDRGFIATWCPQEQVLNHPSIGGFMTHCGWNSTLDSLCAGVPMICWPWFADQLVNCRYSCIEWGIGMVIDGDVNRDHVEKVVRELMEGDYGKNLKKKSMEWKTVIVEATSKGGSTSINFEKLVNDILME